MAYPKLASRLRQFVTANRYEKIGLKLLGSRQARPSWLAAATAYKNPPKTGHYFVVEGEICYMGRGMTGNAEALSIVRIKGQLRELFFGFYVVGLEELVVKLAAFLADPTGPDFDV